METFEFEVAESEPSIRLDTWLHKRLPQISRTALSRLIEERHISVNGNPSKSRYAPKLGDLIQVRIPEAKPSELTPQDIPLDTLYEDEHLLVINKAAGICVHPSAGHPDGTLVNALLHHCKENLSGIGGVMRPGIVHRLDQDTSGCIVVAKDDPTHTGLAEQFAARTTSKSYDAITCGSVRPKEGEIVAPIARHPSHRKRMAVTDGSGKEAHTSYRLVTDYTLASLVNATLHTGRTHQIRVHFKHIGYPLFGDETYGNRPSKQLAERIRFTPARQMLHARSLSFTHPITSQVIAAEAPIPEDMQRTMDRLQIYREQKA